MIEPAVQYSILLIFIALALFTFGMVLLYVRMVAKYLKLKDEYKKEREDASGTIVKAEQEAEKILEDASSKARQMVENIRLFTESKSDLMNEELRKASQIYQESYKKSVSEVQTEAIKLLRGIPQEIGQVLNSEITNMRMVMQGGIQNAVESARRLVENAYKNAENEVNNYKNARMKQVDDSIVAILREVARNVLAKEINQEEHEKLVMRALEEAKKTHVFRYEQEDEADNTNSENKLDNPRA